MVGTFPSTCTCANPSFMSFRGCETWNPYSYDPPPGPAALENVLSIPNENVEMEYQTIGSLENATRGAIFQPRGSIHCNLGTKVIHLAPRRLPTTEGTLSTDMETDDGLGPNTLFVNPPLLSF